MPEADLNGTTTSNPRAAGPAPAVSTGVAGLDDILRGGLPAGRLYLVEGDPGAGKTTLALQYLREGIRLGEPVLYISLSETREELLATGDSHGWDLRDLPVVELVPSEARLGADAQLTMFHPSELELGETTEAMMAAVEKHRPRRLVLDSLSELRLVAQSSLRYRRQILALKQYFVGRDCTVLLLDDRTGDRNEDAQLQSIAHGVVQLEQRATDYGAERRRLRVMKMRAVPFRGGHHDYVIRTGGLDVFPRLVANEHAAPSPGADDLSSGLPALDSLLRGGLPSGTSTLLIGPAGTCKSTIATQFAVAAANRGQRAALFIFDEILATFLTRSRKLGLDVEPHLASGLMTVQQIDPAELSPGEFAAAVRSSVEGSDVPAPGRPAKVVVIDSLNGYLNAMAEEGQLTRQLHELLTYLGQKGAITLMNVTQSGMIGSQSTSPIDTTYLADNVILFRFFEARGRVRRAVSVVKKRSGDHEPTIRELQVGAGGVRIGPPLEEFQGILNGTPTFLGTANNLMTPAAASRGEGADVG